MTAYALLLAGFALGHVCLLVLAVNIPHGLGFRSSRTEPITLGALAVIGIATVAGTWWLVQHRVADWPPALRVYAGICLLFGLVGLPASEIARRLRRERRSVLSESLVDVDLSATVPSRRDGASFLFSIPGNQSDQLQVKEFRVSIPGLPPVLEELSLVHLTDLHMSPALGRDFFQAVADRAAGFEADLVLCTGDIVEHLDAIDWVEPILGPLRGRLGQFAILGNHDEHYEPDRIREALRSAGFTSLDGGWSVIEHEGHRLALGGTSAPWGPALDGRSVPEADVRIVMSHSPDQFPRISAWQAVDLILSGHNHGGQIRLPLLGPILMPSRYSRRYDRGFFRTGRTLLYVGQGIGAKHPLRLNCPPELTRLVLVGDRESPDLEPGDALTAGAAV